ncbi:MAG: lipopolysaccharide assembly protein LapA domain-containing protein [Aquificaceae bacterium]
MTIVKLLVVLLILVAFFLFVAQNSGYVEVSFLHQTYKMPLFVLLLISFAVGFILPSLYFVFKETFLKRKLHLIEKGLKEYSRGYINKAESVLKGLVRSVSGVEVFVVEALKKQGKLEDLKAYSSINPALVGEAFLESGKEEAEEEFKKAISQDGENLRALKGLRDFYALKEDWQKALEYQERVLQVCEKWEKDHQKRIKAEIMAKGYLTNGEEKLIEKAIDLFPTPFVYAIYIKYLLSQDKIKDAGKYWEKAFSLNYHEEVIRNLLEDEATLTKLLDLIQSKSNHISPDTLALVYIRLNLFSKAKEIEESLSVPIKALLHSTLSHREEDKYCVQSLWRLLKPFECSCGKIYDRYEPLCSGCLRWGEIKLRRV